MNEPDRILALIVAAGFVGGLLVTSLASGMRRFCGWLLWLVLPFVVAAFLVAAGTYSTLNSDQASQNFSFGMALITSVVAVPWLLASLLGGLSGLLFRKRRPAPLPLPARLAEPLTDDGLPDWGEADNPPLSLDELGRMMHGAAELAAIDPEQLPDVGPVPGGEGEFIDRDKSHYIYMRLERGEARFDHRSVIADELLYRVFVDQAFALAASRLGKLHGAGERFPDWEYAERLAAEQEAILADIDPTWGNQFAHERAQRAGG